LRGASAPAPLTEGDEAATPLRVSMRATFLVFTIEHHAIAPAQNLLAKGRASGDRAMLHAALEHIEQQRQIGQAAGLVWLQSKALALQALVYTALDDPSTHSTSSGQAGSGQSGARAVSSLAAALALAEPAGYIRLFVDEGAPMAALLRQAAARGIAPDYVARLLAAFGELKIENEELRSVAAPNSQFSIFNSQFEALSERELEVVRLLAQGRSVQEIAARMIISAHTARTHIKNIYSKLDVHSRVQLVEKARALGLL